MKRCYSPFLSALVMAGFLISSIYLGGIGGCGGGGDSSGSSGSVTLSTIVSLPSVSSASLSSLNLAGGGVMKAATTEVPKSGVNCEFVDGETDTVLGTCKTGSDGSCNTTATVTTGEHNIFVRVLNDKKDELAGSVSKTTVTSGGTVSTKVNSEEDLAYKSYLATCEKQLGKACKPGENIREGIAKVVPDCVRGAFKELVREESGVTDQDTAGKYMRGLLEAHKSNMASGLDKGEKPPVDLACVMKGDATCKTSFANTVGNQVSALTMKNAVTVDTSTATATATRVLEKVVDSLCKHAEAWKTVATKAKDESELAGVAKLIKTLDYTKVGDVDNDAFKAMVTKAQDIGKGYAFFKDPYGARAMMETILSGGLKKDITDETEFKKRMAVMLGGEPPKSFDESKTRARGAFNMFGATNWGGASIDDCAKRFGPALVKNQDNFVRGGSKAFDTLIEKFGGIGDFAKKFDSYGTGSDAAKAFFAENKQGDVGASCQNTYECLPPGTCNKDGKCAIGSIVTSFTGGFGTKCTADSDCASDKGFKCDGYTSQCIYASGQAAGGNFGVGGVEFKPPATGVGSTCTTDSQCSSGNVCISGGCFPPPPGGYAGGAPLDSKCTADSDCISKNCKGGQCTIAGGWANGHFCTDKSQCSSGGCNGSICGSATATVTKLGEVGDSCSGGYQCLSGKCSGGLCASITLTKQDDGVACPSFNNLECKSGNCFLGTCKAAGVTTKSDGAGCTSSSECTSPSTCQIPSGMVNGYCGTKGYGSYSCTSDAGCHSPYTCKSGTCQY